MSRATHRKPLFSGPYHGPGTPIYMLGHPPLRGAKGPGIPAEPWPSNVPGHPVAARAFCRRAAPKRLRGRAPDAARQGGAPWGR